MARRVNREESWDSLNDSEISSSGFDDESNTEEMEGHAYDLPSGESTFEHDMPDDADPGLGAVEQFAEALDRLSQRARPARQRTCLHALPFVREYERIASDAAAQLADATGRPGARTPTSRSPSRHRVPPGAETTAVDVELRRWELERQTWQLAGLMLQVQYPVPDAPSGPAPSPDALVRPAPDLPVYELSSEHDAWRAYLGASDEAWEQHVVAQWLQDCAEADGPALRDVVGALEDGAERGTGLGAHGWIATKESLKDEKRLRGATQPLQPGDAFVGERRGADLVTQLDPDACARQRRRLEAADASFERATWLACWTLLRRGRGWDAIRRWCRRRSEGWRALALRADPRFGADPREAAGAGAPSQALWRQTCRRAAHADADMDVYECAVYGILCGDHASVARVLAGWNDCLFGRYSCELIRNFDAWVALARPPPHLLRDAERGAPPSSVEAQFTSGERAWKELLADGDLREEVQQPLKLIQGALVSKTFPNWIFRQGLRMGQRQAGQHDDAAAAGDADLDADACTPDTLRVLTHLLLAFGEVGDDTIQASVATDNVIDAYVAHLGARGKLQLLPLYAHLLSPAGANRCLARQLPRITDPAERATMAGLMAQYDIDALAVLRTHLDEAAAAACPRVTADGSHGDGATGYPLPDDFCAPVRLVEEGSAAWNGQPPIDPAFLEAPSSGIGAAADGLIGAVEWYLCLDGAHYHATLAALVDAYSHLFRTGQLAAAVELRERAPLTVVFATQAPATSDGAILPAAIDAAAAARDLEALAAALAMLHGWLETLGPLQASQQRAGRGAPRDPADKARAREQRDEHRQAHGAVQEAVEPLLSQFLEGPVDDAEAAQFAALRRAFLPELAIAYISVLDLDGHLLSREHLARALDVAAVAAQTGSALGRALAATGGGAARLLAAAARASANVVRARGERKPAKGRAERGLEIWDVRAPPEEAA